MNHITITGNVVNKELTYTTAEDPLAICKIRVATDKPHGREGTIFFNVKAFRRTAENCDTYLHKGSKIAVAGYMNIEEYEKDGQKKLWPEIIAEEVEFLDRIER